MDPLGLGKSVWEVWGPFGDTIGGCANLITMVLAGVGLRLAGREIKRAREVHAHETRVASAKDVWRATFAVTRQIGILLELLKNRLPISSFREQFDNVERTYTHFGDATADAALVFSHEVFKAVDEVNHAAAAFFDSLTACTKENYETFDPSVCAQPYRRLLLAQGTLFPMLGRIVHVDEFDQWQKSMVPYLAEAETKMKALGFEVESKK